MNIGKKMKDIRAYDLTTQKDVANQMGISEKTYGLYENDNALIPLKHLNTFCNYFDVSIDYMLGFTNIKKYKTSNNIINNLEVGKRLKQLRRDINITQIQLANLLNCNRTLLTKYEDGKCLISLANLFKICKKYQISADYILGKIDYKTF